MSAGRWLFIVASALIACGAAAAEMIEKGKSPARTKPTPVESMARIADDAPRSVLKCWQEGRLIFEGSGMTLPEGSPGGGVVPMKGANGRTVQLLDLRQGLCILERTNG